MAGAKGKKSFRWAGFLQGVVCLFLILYGMCLSMESVLDTQIPQAARLFAVAALTAILQLVQLGVKWAMFEILVFAGGLSVFCIRYQEILLIAAKQLANRVLELVNAYNRSEYLLWYLDVQQDYRWAGLLLVFVLLGFLEGLLFMRTRNRTHHFLITAILPAALVASGLMVGWAASSVGIFLIFTGLVWEILDMGERGNVVLGMIVAVSIGLPVLLTGNGRLWGPIERLHVDWYRRQLNLEDQMLAWLDKVSDFSLFSFGERKTYPVGNHKPEYDGKEVFKMTVDYPIARPLYIRGFVGGTYEDGTWNRISRQEFSDWARQKGSDEEAYAEIVQSFPYEFLLYSQWFSTIGNEKHVTLTLAQEKKDCALMPYFTKFPEEQDVLADGIYPPGKETTFTWDSYLELTDYDREIAGGLYMEMSENHRIEKKYDVFADYQEYAKEKYTRLPEEGLKKFKSYVRQYRKTHPSYWEQNKAVSEKFQASENLAWTLSDLDEILTGEEMMVISMTERQYIIQEVQKMLWGENEYSLDLLEVPEGEDSVEFFLFDQHKGYCTHFATAATLLFRANDIPARFVSGYLVMPSDFKRNGDGTWTASVSDERAHAWTEILYDNVGFCPVETTPPEYTELLEGMEEGQNLQQAVHQMEENRQKQQNKQEQEDEEKLENKEEAEDSKNPGNHEGIMDKGRQGESKTEKTADSNFWIWGIFGGAVFLAGICFVFKRCRRWVLCGRQRRLTAEDRTYAVMEIGRETGRILRLMGKRRQPGMSDREYGTFLSQEVGRIDWERTFFVLQKARFSKSGVTEDEYQQIFLTYQKLERELVSVGGMKGWYLRYIKIYP